MSTHNSIVKYEILLNLTKPSKKEENKQVNITQSNKSNKPNYEMLLNLTNSSKKEENKMTNINEKLINNADLEPEIESYLEPEIETNLEPEIESHLEPNLEPEIESHLEPNLEPEIESHLEPDLEPFSKKDDHNLGKKPKPKFNLDKINKINKNISEEYKVLKDTIKIDELIEKITNNINLDIIELVNIYKTNDKNIANTTEIFLLKFIKKMQENRVF